ncbi:MAG: RIP metalloprotease RseP [Nitrospirae bacterium]|nr:RIP metalloprotease RseP [Nitrospirota bacterium]
MTFLYAILLLGILIVVHELGHFLFAKLLGIKVTKFSLGLGPKLIGKQYGETEYLVSAIPFGGYVKMYGEEMSEELREEEKERAFSTQPIYKRAIVVSAGAIFNIIFAALLFFMIYIIGVPRLTATVGDLSRGAPADRAGFKKGDTISSINGKPVKYWDEITGIIHDNPGKPIQITVRRATHAETITVTPEKKASKNIFGETISVGLIGITPTGDAETVRFSVFDAFSMGIKKTWEIIVLTLTAIVKLVERVVPADTIGGPIMIFQLASKQAQNGFISFVTLMAVISINLGVFNLFPIPVLDGGHILYLAIEKFRNKPLSEQIMVVSQKIGLAFLLLLMAFAIYNDVLRLFKPGGMP